MTPRHQELAHRKIVSALSALKHMIYCDISAVCDIAEVIPGLLNEGACGPVVVEDSGVCGGQRDPSIVPSPSPRPTLPSVRVVANAGAQHLS
jgi:hypothetical protein